MIKNYVKTSLRSFRRHPGYAAINLTGLALGIGCCILALLFLRHEVTYDQFHENIDDIYRLTARFNRTITMTVVPDPLVPAAVETIPEITNGTRMWESRAIVRQGNMLHEETATYVDPAFFEVFSFPMLSGNAALDSQDALLLTPVMAEKYFGRADPVGEVLELRLGDAFRAFTVAGVTEAAPENSTISFDILLPLELRYEVKETALQMDWSRYGVIGFLQLAADADTATVKSRLLALLDTHLGDSIRDDGESLEDYAYQIASFATHHLSGGGLNAFGLAPGTSASYVYLLALIAGIVLVIACFNFMNLSIGQASGRLKEIGVRKVVGARRKQLVTQFFVEALILSLFAALLGCVWVHIALPLFNDVAGANLPFNIFEPFLMASVSSLVLITTLVAGFYPALMLSGMRVVSAFTGKFRLGGANFFTRTLVVCQFTCTIVFLIGTMYISRQHDFMRDASLGFEDEQLVMIPTMAPENEPEAGAALLDRFKETLNGAPGIQALAGTSDAFTLGNSATLKELPDGQQKILFTYRVDDNFLETMGLELMAGRNFDSSLQSDAQSGIIVNETFAKTFGMDEPVGQVVPVDLVGIEQPRIIGVVKDFHFESLHAPVKPVFLHQRTPYKINYVLARIAPESMPATIELLRDTWTSFKPEHPFVYHFLDEAIDSQYKAEERWATAMRYASGVAIFIACLGLLGLTSITMTRRKKEIGIRKVLGASLPGLMNLLTREFALLILLANVIAWPLAYLSVGRWLEDFPYKIELGAGVFLLVGVLTLGIALLTISYQSIKTAMADPVKSLRYE